MRRGEWYKPVSNRLRWYDYSQNGAYFVTICVKDRACIFWEIQENKMLANEIGKVVENEIINTEQMRKNVTIDSYVVMPNHIHMIVIIYDDISGSVETHCNASLYNIDTNIKTYFDLRRIV